MAISATSSNWDEIERQLEKKELELVQQQGITLPEGHREGYKYVPQTRVLDKESWEVLPGPSHVPKCSSSNWSHTDVTFELGEGIAYITLNRPAANNALNEAVAQALHDACFELHQRKDIRIAVLRAEGKMFCAGGEPKSFVDAVSLSAEAGKKASVKFMKLLYYFQSLPQFTIGLAQGSAMGTGVGLLAACDVVCAVAAARFAVSEVKLGTVPATIAPFVASKVGQANAIRILCTGENVSAQLAKQMGLIAEIVDDEMDFSKYVEGICQQMTLCAPVAAARSKRLVQNVARQPLSLQLLQYVGRQLADIRIGDEAVKGMVAVQERKKPYWAEAAIKPLY